MANDWDHDAPQAPSSDNPFAPIDFTSRLKAAPKRAESLYNAPPLRPGQLYGAQPWLAPPKPLVPPSAAAGGAQPAPGDDGSSRFVPPHPSVPFTAPVDTPPVESTPAYAQPDTLPPYLQRRPLITPHRPPAPAAQRPALRSTFAQPASAAQDAPTPFGGDTPAPVPFEDTSATERRRRSRLVEHAAMADTPASPQWGPEPPQPQPFSAAQDAPYAAEPLPPMPEPPEMDAPYVGADNVIPFPHVSAPWQSPAASAQAEPYWAEPDDASAPPISFAGEPDAQQPLTVDEIAAFFNDPPPDADVPTASMDEPFFDPTASASFVPPQAPPDAPLRDAFDPAGAAPKATKPAKETPPRPARPPVRPLRVIALIGAFLMLVFCLVEGAYILRDLTQNEQQMEAAREEFRARTGKDLHSGASRVDLPPDGQTFSPTQTPAPTVAVQTPAPTTPANRTVFGRSDTDVPLPSDSSPTPALRTKATDYPNNPLHNVMESLLPLREENRDVVGHLVIDGVVDEVVVHRNNIYYLTRNYRGTTSAAGAVFADESCSFRYPPENLLLRGQSAVAGKTFEPLLQFATAGRDFVASHTTAQLTTLYEEATYHLFAVIVADSDPTSSGYFNYASQPTFATDEDMLRYVESARAHSLYQFSVDVLPSDRLLTLATVGKGSQCLVLLYRRER